MVNLAGDLAMPDAAFCIYDETNGELTMTTTASEQRRKLGYEGLEARTLMAGNVAAAINQAGNLEIRGDSKDNFVVVTQFNSGEWKLQGVLGTKINGHNSEKFTYRGGMDVSLGRGNDGFEIVKGNLEGALDVRTSNGIDGVALMRFKAWSIFVHTGADTDALLVANVTVSGPDEQPPTAALVAGEYGSAIFQTSSGDDYVLLAKLTAANVAVHTHGGRDTVGLLAVTASGELRVNLGDDNLDILAGVKNTAAVASFDGGDGLADIYLHASNSFVEVNTAGFEFDYAFDAYFEQLETLVETYLPLVQQLPGFQGLPQLKL
jgi:hypothetical protein